MNFFKGNNRKSFVLVASLLTASILVILVLAYITRVVADYKFTTKIHNLTAAIDIAETGIERALWEIQHNGGAFNNPWNTTIHGDGTVTSTLSVNSFKNQAGGSMGDYTVDVWIAADKMTATATSTGYVPNRTSPEGKRKIKVVYARHNFARAIAALTSVTMSGQAMTDSYDSSLGAYAAQPHTKQGDVITNGTIGLSGQVKINGDANPGPGHPFPPSPPPSNYITGTYGTLAAPFTVDPIPASTIPTIVKTINDNGNIQKGRSTDPSPLNGNALSVSSQNTITLPGGTYYFTSVSASSQSIMNVTGPSTIYVDSGGFNTSGQSIVNITRSSTISIYNGTLSTSGQATINISKGAGDTNGTTVYTYGGDMNISGQGIVNNGVPKDLLMYSTGSSISLSGQAAFTGAIYAPNAKVTLSGQDNFFGSIICGTDVDSGQAKIHFDLDLLNVSPVFASNRITSWQEIR